jgi:hypothetical protein
MVFVFGRMLCRLEFLADALPLLSSTTSLHCWLPKCWVLLHLVQLAGLSGGGPPPSWFLLFVCVGDFVVNPWITCESFVSITLPFLHLFFLMKNTWSRDLEKTSRWVVQQSHTTSPSAKNDTELQKPCYFTNNPTAHTTNKLPSRCTAVTACTINKDEVPHKANNYNAKQAGTSYLVAKPTLLLAPSVDVVLHIAER